MGKYTDLATFLESIEREELNDVQQLLLVSFGGAGGLETEIKIEGNNVIAGCGTNNCKGGNCGNCVAGCGAK